MTHTTRYIGDIPCSSRQGIRLLLIILALFLSAKTYPLEPGGTGNINIFSFDIFSIENGLPNNQIQCIFQDKKGWIWLGTSRGLSRFDGYRFVNYIHNPADTNSLSGSLVRVIFEDSRGRLLIGTENGGLNIFDREKELFSHPFRNYPDIEKRNISVNAIRNDNNENLYLGTDRGLMMLDPEGNLKDITPVPGNRESNFTNIFIRTLRFDNYGKLWIGSTQGLFVYDPVTNFIETITIPSAGNDMAREIFVIFKDTDGSLLIGTYSNGLVIADPETKMIRNIKLEPVYERTNTIRAISKGPLGDYWIGTRGGLYLYSTTNGVKGFFRHDPRDEKSLANNSVLDIFHDINGETWIGTRGGLNLLAKSKQVFRSFTAMPDNRRYLNSGIIYAFEEDENNRIWAGTEDGGINIYDPLKGSFEYMMSDNDNPESISENCIKALLDDKKGNMWIGTFWGGIDVLNLKTGMISHYKHSPGKPGTLSDNRVWSVCQDKKENIWVGTTAGVDLFEPTSGTFIQYPELADNIQVNWIRADSEGDLWIGTLDEIVIFNPENSKIIRHDERTRYFHEDAEKKYWIATLDKGLALYSKTDGAVRYFTEKDGLANDQTLCILEDDNKHLWISTSNGLSDFDCVKEQFMNYSTRDGIVNNQFNYGAALKLSNGEFLFGGNSGFNIFNPREIVTEHYTAPLVFTELRIFNKPVRVNDNNKAILTKSISETEHLFLDYSQNVFSLEFAALDYINSSKNFYSWFLEGFDRDWNAPGTSRSATYTNLYPGDYILHVRRSRAGNIQTDDELTLKITISPPYWMTWWFRTVIIFFILTLIFVLLRFLINREKIKNELIYEKTKARNLHELDMLKLRLFTNISHEIRTPLTLIMGPLEKIINKRIPGDEISANLELVQRNTKKLNRLINQLLDFRKIETGNLKLEKKQDDLVPLVAATVRSFEQYAEEKQISLKFISPDKSLIAFYDPEKIETIVGNLVSNAIKYSDEGGIVSVRLSLVFAPEEDAENHDDKQYIEISVRDNGRGITEENKEKIFSRFFRSDPDHHSTGTGIGLALVKELVQLHNGKIYVTSNPGKGSRFIIHLPWIKEDPGNLKPGTEKSLNELSDETGEEENLTDSSLKIMLIVEDNPDVRYFISSHFDSVYTVYEAKNGKEGFDKAVKTIPDVIITDILMPDSDGYELCRKIKKDERTSHIPLLLLTALHSKEHEIEGLECGADDYITKPFDISILQTKVENMLQVRRCLKEKYTRQIILEPSEITISSPDERFLRKAIEVVEKNISNADLDIEQFAVEVGVSRMQLYRKFSALTNMTVKEFIRNIRLKRAAQLLSNTKLTVNEITYSVGFKDPSHFRKCFYREYGMSPSEYAGRNSIAGRN